MSKKEQKQKGFTLLEMLAVVSISLILIGLTAITFARSRPSAKVKNDAAQMIAFLRNMWDQTKATGAPLILNPDYEKGRLLYADPRSGREQKAELSSDVKVIGVLLNDRFYNAESHFPPEEEDEESYGEGENAYVNAIYISEGRGLTRAAVVFAISGDEEDEPTHITLAALNLITGKGKVIPLTADELGELALSAQEVDHETE